MPPWETPEGADHAEKKAKLTPSEREELEILRARNEYLEAENEYLKNRTPW